MKEIIKQFKDKNPKPLYLLHGEEPYYIDEITDAATKYVLEDHEKDFNFTLLYGKDVDLSQLLEHVKRYPMMAEKQLIIVKEAQDVRNWDAFNGYFENPTSSTVLILAHKYKKAPANKKFFKLIKKNGEIFESKKLYENQVDAWIMNYLKERGYTITQKATMLLVESLGADLSKIANELKKLAIILGDVKAIDETHIEKNIGISKDYNAFELTNAIASRDVLKANKIINYFEQNPKAAHIVTLIPLIFNFHERLMKAHFSNANDINSLMSSLRMSYPAAKEVMQAKRIYPVKKVANNIVLLQEFDLKSKGINRGPGSDADLLRELIFLLMH
ncbi:MAG TPA: DNA polymerase III subunit delta [Brumimicrobium sp.]|nr:DNA polymerase III subunit delta [Brumimicrobium sp.]